MTALAIVEDHGLLTGLADDDHAQYLLLAGRSGGQTAIGGTVSTDDLTLQANTTVGAQTGRIQMNSAVEFNSISATGALYAFNYAATESYTAAFVGGGLNMSGNIAFTGSTFIYESFRGAPTITSNTAPGFAAYTVLQALPRLEAGALAGHNPLAPLVLNAGPRVNNGVAAVRTTTSIAGVNFAPTVGATVSGATMNVTNITGITVAPKWATAAGSAISFGTVRGLHAQVPAVGLFQPNSGTESMTGYYAVDVDNIGAFSGTAPVAALRSAITAGTNQLFLQNNGNAHSDMGAGHLYWDDNAGPALGGNAGVADFDVWLTWNASGYYRTYFIQNGNSLRWSNPSADRFLFDNDGGSTTGEYNWNCSRFSIGAQTGAVGNQVGNFVTPARTIGVGGDWADFLLTQAGSLTVGGLAMGRVSAWVINPVSYASSSGSVGNADTLTVGGFPTSSPGVTITERQSLHVISGRTRLQSVVQYDPINPAALALGSNNNWAGLLTGTNNNGMRRWARIQGDAGGSTLTGIDATAAQDGDTFDLTNISANTITITNQDVLSLAANRIDLGSWSGTLTADDSCTIRYDATSGFWRVIGSQIA